MTTHTSPAQESSCLAFRRERLADPRHLSSEASAHLKQCGMCQTFMRRADAADARIDQCLNEIPLPQGLNERILLRSFKSSPRRWPAYALAASMLLASFIGLATWSFLPGTASPDLALAAARHANAENIELAVHHSEPRDGLPAILASFGGQLQAPLGEVDYIHFCPIEGFGMGWHIIFNTPQGKATLLLIPAKATDDQVRTVQVEGRSVRVERAGQGYFALITDNMPSLESARQRIRKAVRWST